MVQAAVENDHGEGNVQAATLTITDDDEAAIEVSAMTTTTVRLETTEAGRAETFTVTLATEPTGTWHSRWSVQTRLKALYRPRC